MRHKVAVLAVTVGAAILPSCGVESPGDSSHVPCSPSTGVFLDGSPALVAVSVSRTARVSFRIDRPDACGTVFRRVNWIWGATLREPAIEVRLVACDACTVEYDRRPGLSGAPGGGYSGAARLDGPQGLTFEVTGLRSGQDQLTVTACLSDSQEECDTSGFAFTGDGVLVASSVQVSVQP